MARDRALWIRKRQKFSRQPLFFGGKAFHVNLTRYIGVDKRNGTEFAKLSSPRPLAKQAAGIWQPTEASTAWPNCRRTRPGCRSIVKQRAHSTSLLSNTQPTAAGLSADLSEAPAAVARERLQLMPQSREEVRQLRASALLLTSPRALAAAQSCVKSGFLAAWTGLF